MNREPVSSSNIRAIGYDPNTQVLEVEFTNGSVYQYANVPNELHEALMSAGSHGSFFGTEIRRYPNQYPFQRVV